MVAKEGAGNGKSTIEVTVHYEKVSKTHAFERGAKIEQVLTWAIGAFPIDSALASEVELALEGTTEELAGSRPLAALAHGAEALSLDLIRGDIANGGS